MRVLSCQDITEAWLCERVIALLDDSRNEEAQALAEEHGFQFDMAQSLL